MAYMFGMDYEVFAFCAVTLVAILYAIFSHFITLKLGNRQRVKEIQARVNQITKEVQEASKRGDSKTAEKLQGEMSPLLMESMKHQFKPLLVIFPLLFILPGMLRSYFPFYSIKLGFALPVFIQNFDRFPNWRDFFGPVGWFWVFVLFFSLFLQLVFSMKDRFAKKK
ncbi:Uncharacterised protein [Candidatus Gugararchaeum adminiculabundum]|nr:Uncharacterised protein [Candidatus Gugararchaeum adminiculabundum]